MMKTTEVKYWTLVGVMCGFCFHCTMTDDAPEFQYPCYVDVCTFPRQFCNSDKYERRCSPCSVSLCKEERIPLACKYQCNKLKNPVKTTTATSARQLPIISNQGTDSSLMYLLLAYNAILTTLVVLMVIVGAACRVHSIRSKPNHMDIRQASYRSNAGQNTEAPFQAADVITRLPHALCPDCRVIREREGTPPSYRTMESEPYNRIADRNRPVSTQQLDRIESEPLVSQPEQTQHAAFGGTLPRRQEEPPCMQEMTEMETQTTPKLSFDFNSTYAKSQ